MTPEELLQGLEQCGYERLDNQGVAGRGWPPIGTSPLHPAGFPFVYDCGDLFKQLQDKLPEPRPRPSMRMDFASVATPEPGASPAAPGPKPGDFLS